MCRVLMVHFSGFYAWLKEPLSARALEDARQTELIQQAWADSGKVYGYRKLADDLRDAGETCSENRVARLASIAGIAKHRSATNAALVDMVVSQRSSLTILWIGSSRLMRLIGSG
jgi:transposase InsO family protein